MALTDDACCFLNLTVILIWLFFYLCPHLSFAAFLLQLLSCLLLFLLLLRIAALRTACVAFASRPPLLPQTIKHTPNSRPYELILPGVRPYAMVSLLYDLASLRGILYVKSGSPWLHDFCSASTLILVTHSLVSFYAKIHWRLSNSSTLIKLSVSP